ncbi:MAG: 50S ribosomal protein L4 [Lachnospiraceae bacterium]|nr:50S ribosomal protein L4 [Lachnospiraceae bacterium]
MASVNVYNIDGKEVDKIDLNDAIFGVEINEHLLHMARVVSLSNNRQGTKKQKTRAEVSGGGKKPWRQKGTGNARQGSIRSPQWKGGGMVFAAVPRDFTKEMNKKEKRMALKSALTNCVKENNFVVVDKIDFPEIKTKNFKKVLDNLKIDKSLVVLDSNNKNVIISARNIKSIKTAAVNELNVYDIMKYEKILITKDAVKNVEEVYK